MPEKKKYEMLLPLLNTKGRTGSLDNVEPGQEFHRTVNISGILKPGFKEFYNFGEILSAMPDKNCDQNTECSLTGIFKKVTSL